ncbi:MAG: glycosyltransferase family 39 protein [Cytophagales bacterium]|nr:glycosyltransferase family 39 protein [Cytophagales bacterium]
MERDEGEYAYFGQLILQGIAPYLEAYNMKFPGTYFSYAVIELFFGQTAWGLHFGLLLVNIATIFLLFNLTDKILKNKGYGVIAAGVYALSSLSYTVLGFAAHATHFVVLAAVGGIVLLYRAFESKKALHFAIAGFVIGLSYLMKQSGFFFFLFGCVFILIQNLKEKPFSFKQLISQGLIFGFSAFAPFVLTVGILWTAGSFDTFYFWTFQYASSYGGQVPFSQATEMFNMSFKGISDSYGFFWFLALVGIVGPFFIPGFFWEALTIASFAVFAFLSVCPGFYFRQHYFIQYLPALGITFASAGYFLDYILKQQLKTNVLGAVKYVLFGLICLVGINKESKYLFKEKPLKLSRIIYGSNPFPESIQLADFLKKKTTEQDKIAILGSEPQIFFYSGRKSATGYIYTYNLMEVHPYSLKMQKEMISEVEKSKPKYLLFVNVAFSWLSRPDSEKFIFDWYGKYINENYNMVALMDLVGFTGNFVTENVSAYQPQSKEYIIVFERKK